MHASIVAQREARERRCQMGDSHSTCEQLSDMERAQLRVVREMLLFTRTQICSRSIKEGKTCKSPHNRTPPRQRTKVPRARARGKRPLPGRSASPWGADPPLPPEAAQPPPPEAAVTARAAPCAASAARAACRWLLRGGSCVTGGCKAWKIVRFCHFKHVGPVSVSTARRPWRRPGRRCVVDRARRMCV